MNDRMTLTAPTIRVLPAVVADQIAAGEVVTRPASVARELVDNAIDAGATKITVEIAAGGSSLVRVVDDGHGMSEDDARLCILRHATSKIRSADDLVTIRSLGFRGEALPSIASVSKLRIRTRRAQDEQGSELDLAAGELLRVGPCGCAPGSSVEVRDLFYNLPARKKFMRALSTESARVTETLLEAALARHALAITLIRDGRMARRWPSCLTRADRAADVLGEGGWIACTGERGPMRVEAYLAEPSRARSGMAGLRFVVNGRPVADRVLARAVATAYGEALDRGRYPLGVVYVELPAELVDVNVHPQKAEVRFAHARAVTDAVHSVVRPELLRALGTEARVSPGEGEPPRRPDGWLRARDRASAEPTWSWEGSGQLPASSLARNPATGATTSPEQPSSTGAGAGADSKAGAARGSGNVSASPGDGTVVSEGTAQSARLLGWLRNGWLAFDLPDGLAVLDLEAATRAELRQRLARAPLPVGSKQLLFPVVREVSGARADEAETRAAPLATFGIELRRAGACLVSLVGVPALLDAVDADALLESLLAWITTTPARPSGAPVTTWPGELTEQLARHAIVAPVTNVTSERALDLLDAALGSPDGPAHGGVVAKLDWADLRPAAERPR